MRRLIIILAYCTWLMALVASCQNTSTEVRLAATNTPSTIWDTWLSAPACKPPCWQGITPGTTSISEAASILKNMPDVMIKFQDNDSLSWYFKKNTEGGAIWARQDGIVSRITLESISDRKLLLETVIDSYGNPQYVKPYDCREGMCVTALVYPKLGMFLSIFIPNNGNVDVPQFEILPDTNIDRVSFIEPGIANFEKNSGFQEHNLDMEWKGYGEYQ